MKNHHIIALLGMLVAVLALCLAAVAQDQQGPKPAATAEQPAEEAQPVYRIVVTVTEEKGGQPLNAWSKSTVLDAQTARNFVAGAEYMTAKQAQQNGEKTAPKGEQAVVSLVSQQLKLLIAQSITELASVQAAQRTLNATNEKLNALEFKD